MVQKSEMKKLFAPLMEPHSRNRARPWASCSLHNHHVHHHHHPLIVFPHHHHLFLCAYHNHHHGHVGAASAPFPPSNSQLVGAAPLQNEASLFKDATDEYHGTQNMLKGLEHWGLEEAEEDDDNEPIFVLTDEWREFFAKSEAKRRLEKKQAKRKQQK